jgi:hypothetical protein
MLNMENSIKSYVVSWGDTFLEEKKSEIYRIVETMKPAEKASEEQRML